MLSEKLLIVIRLFTIVLLGIFIFTAFQGALIMVELRDTVHTRLANNEFPLPLGEFAGMMQQQDEFVSGASKDADIERQLQRANAACSKTSADCEIQVGLLCELLKQKGFTTQGKTCDSLTRAITANNSAEIQRLTSELQSQLR